MSIGNSSCNIKAYIFQFEPKKILMQALASLKRVEKALQ